MYVLRNIVFCFVSFFLLFIHIFFCSFSLVILFDFISWSLSSPCIFFFSISLVFLISCFLLSNKFLFFFILLAIFLFLPFVCANPFGWLIKTLTMSFMWDFMKNITFQLCLWLFNAMICLSQFMFKLLLASRFWLNQLSLLHSLLFNMLLHLGCFILLDPHSNWPMLR